MANTDLSKETFEVVSVPRITPDLLAFLNSSFPEKCAKVDETLPEIYFYSGQRAVVKYLIRIYEEQNDNVLLR